MEKFVKKHPIAFFFIGLFLAGSLPTLIGWAIGGPAVAGQLCSTAVCSYLFCGVASWVINKAIIKTYEKKTGKTIQEVIEQEEREAKEAREKLKKKEKDNNEDDYYDDGL